MFTHFAPLWFLIAIAFAAPALAMQETHLFSPTVNSFAHFGTSVAASGGTVVVGAIDEEEGVYQTGAAHVFTFSAGGWTRLQRLVASDSASLAVSDFGQSVAIEGDTILIGAPGSPQAGAAYVFTRSGTTWTEQAKLVAQGGVAFDRFGAAVAVAGDVAVIGAPDRDESATDDGIAYVFTRSGTVWDAGTELTPLSTAVRAAFGSAVSISGGTIVIGAPGPDFPATLTGSAHVFVGAGSSWSEDEVLVPGNGVLGDLFGAAVDFDGSALAVGAPGRLVDRGAVYVYEASTWTQVVELGAIGGGPFDAFGTSVSRVGDLLAVGAPSSTGVVGGAVHVFALRNGTWVGETVLERIDGEASDDLGASVVVTGAAVVAGAPFDDLGIPGASAAHGLAFGPSAGALWTVTAAEELLSIEPFPGGTVVGGLGFERVRGLAFDPATSTLYGTEVVTNELLRIDTTTGAATVVGSLGFDRVHGLAFDPNTNTLYGSDILTDQLISIDTATGAGTSIGALGFDKVRGLAFDPVAGALYGSDVASNRLLSIDTTTGAGTIIGSLKFVDVGGLTFDTNAGKLYGTSRSGTCELIEIDTVTGAGTKIAPLFADSGGSAFAFDVDLTQTYCTAGMSASGCQAAISATGTPSASATPGFSLQVSGVEGNKRGLFFWGSNGRQATAWYGGTSFQCVVTPVKRGSLLVAVGTPGACDGAYSYDLSARWTAKPNQNPGAGVILQSQFWYRDPFNPSSAKTSLSDAIEVLVGL